MRIYDFQKQKEKDRSDTGLVGSLFVFWLTMLTTDSILLAAVLTVAFLLALPTLHEKVYKMLNEKKHVS